MTEKTGGCSLYKCWTWSQIVNNSNKTTQGTVVKLRRGTQMEKETMPKKW